MAGKSRIDAVRARNRAALLAALRRGGARSRTALAADTGLSGATVSAIGAQMLAEGLIAPAEIVADPAEAAAAAESPARGRPQAPLGLNPARASVVAAVISARAVTVALADYAGRLVARAEGPPLPRDACAAALTAALIARIDALRLHAATIGSGDPPLRALTVAVQGVTDAEARRVLWSPVLDAQGVDFAAPLGARYGAPVAVVNDCAMSATALARRQPALGPDFAVILVGPGVGMGLVLGGALVEGRRSSAMEFGHMTHQPGGAPCACGRLGCVEAYAADYAILRAAGRQACGDADALAAEARAGDGAARAAFSVAGAALGYGLGRLFALVGPVKVALIGPGARAADLIEPAMRAALEAALAPALSAPLSLTLAPDETALALEGAALHALQGLDAGYSAGAPAPKAAAGKPGARKATMQGAAK